MNGAADIFRICGGALVSLVCLLVIRSADRSGGMGTAASAGFSFLMIAAAITAALPIVSAAKELCTPYLSSLPEGCETVLFRAAACGMTVQVTTDIIRDAGEEKLAEKAELAGRAVLLAMGFPLIRELLSAAKAFFGI